MKDQARLEMYKIAWEDFLAHPVFGRGPATFEIPFRQYRTETMTAVYGPNVQDHAHNLPLHVLATMGLPGFVAMAWVCMKIQAHLPASRPAKAGLIAIAVNSLFNPLSIEVWCLAAVLAAICANNIVMESKPVRWTTFVVGMAVMTLSVSFFKAENLSARGRAKLFPCETRYAIQYTNHLVNQINRTNSRKVQADLLREAYGVAQTMQACRPRSAEAQLVAASLYGYADQAGVPGMGKLRDAAALAGLALDPRNQMLQIMASGVTAP